MSICQVHQISVTGSIGSFGAFDNSGSEGLRRPCMWGCCGSVLGLFCWNCFWWSLSQSSSIFLQMGQFSSHPHFSAFFAAIALSIACLWVCDSIFMRGLEVVVVVRGISQSFLNSKRFPDIFPTLGHGVPMWVGIFLSGEGLLSEVPS